MALLDFFNKRNKDPKAEMSFIDHLEDLRWHVIRSVIAVVIGAIVVFIYSDFVVNQVLFAPTRVILFLPAGFAGSAILLVLGNTLCFPDVKSQIFGEYHDRAIHCFFYPGIYRRIYYCISICFLGILEVCAPRSFTNRKKENQGCYFLGLLIVFYRVAFGIYPYSFYGQFLF
jgi:sec-independent protein translocase protein TatC